MNFMVVISPSPYNGIIGRPGLRKVQAVLSTAHVMLKLLVEEGIVTLRSNIVVPTVMEGVKVAIHTEYLKQTITIGGSLSEKMKDGALQPAQRQLGHICLEAGRHDRQVTKLVESGIMRDVHYHDWLSNPDMVKKHDVAERGAKPQRKIGKLKQIPIQVRRKVTLFFQDLKKMHEEERLLMDTESGKGNPRHEVVYSRTTNGNRTKTKRRANNVPLCNQRSGEREVLAIVEEEVYRWMTPLIEYLAEGTLPKSFLEPWLRCVGPAQAEYVVREIHEGSCSMHSGLRFVAAKAIRSRYYWPTMHKDAWNIIKKYDDCQTHRPVPKNPQQKLTPITCPWPFYKWGIDISGPFLEGQGKVKFLIIVVDYFTKWIEAKPVTSITGSQVKKFVWYDIVRRFRLPGEIISDNGKQFRDNPFKDWCEKLNIKQRLGEGNKNCVEEVPHVLWAHRTMIKTSIGDTLFSLTYGTEVVIPVEIGMPLLRCAEVNQAENDEGLLLNLDILEERREKVAVGKARSKAKMEKYYNAKVCSLTFRPKDFVYRSNEANRAKKTESWVQNGKDHTK
ncbi:reverse transcriptase domain-containing protein [Tanacetum coccineum]